jgi:hypothetical protein
LRHVAFREVKIIENALGIRPLLEKVVVLEEMVNAAWAITSVCMVAVFSSIK